MENKGLFSERQEHNSREKAFAEEWERENTNCRAIDYGWGTLQNLFIKTDGPGGRLLSHLFHRRIVAWLECGHVFFALCKKKCRAA
jgi:hypothetical protein